MFVHPDVEMSVRAAREDGCRDHRHAPMEKFCRLERVPYQGDKKKDGDQLRCSSPQDISRGYTFIFSDEKKQQPCRERKRKQDKCHCIKGDAVSQSFEYLQQVHSAPFIKPADYIIIQK